MKLSIVVGIAFVLLATVASADIRADGNHWLKEVAKEEGIIKLKSGLLIRILKKGTGMKNPKLGTECNMHYTGTFGTYKNGQKFDSSYDKGKPAKIKAEDVIAGWKEAMLLMRDGDHWEIFVPQKLAYGKKGHGKSDVPIPPFAALKFEMELINCPFGGRKFTLALKDLEEATGMKYEDLPVRPELKSTKRKLGGKNKKEE